jgi:CBS domain-containing protein
MAAVFAAASRATFAFIIFAFEITRDYNAVLPLMLVCVIADLIAQRLMVNSIMTEKLARRGLHIPQEYEIDVMQQVNVAEVMDSNPPTVPASMMLDELASRIARSDRDVIRRQGTLIVDESGRLVGIITRGDVLRAVERSDHADMTVLDAGSTDLLVTYPDELIFDAVSKMLQNDIGRLPVVDRRDPSKPIGYLGREAILKARLKRLEEEHVREPGWIGRAGAVTPH